MKVEIKLTPYEDSDLMGTWCKSEFDNEKDYKDFLKDLHRLILTHGKLLK